MYEAQAICPTRVGMNRRRRLAISTPWNLPHTRGDEPLAAGAVEADKISAPHAWG